MSESLRDQLEANLDKIVTVEEAPVVETATPEPEAAASTPSGAAGSAPESKVSDRPRAPDGKFIERKESAPVAAKPDTPTKPTQQAPIPPTGAAPAKPAPQRPSSWKKDYWAHWDKLTGQGQLAPEEAQALAAYIAEREGQYQQGVSTYKTEWDRAKPVMDALAPYTPLLEQHGIQPQAWIANMGAAHRELALGSPQQKLARFAWLAQQYGLPVQALVDENVRNQYLQSAPAQQTMQPQQQGVLTVEQARALFQQEYQAQATQQEVARFAKETDKYPHYEAVRETMAQLLDANLAEDLTSAYEAALRHPRHSDLWQQLQEQERARAAQDNAAAAAAKVVQAKGKAVSVRTATPSAPSTEKPKDRRSSLESAYDEVMGGARV